MRRILGSGTAGSRPVLISLMLATAITCGSPAASGHAASSDSWTSPVPRNVAAGEVAIQYVQAYNPRVNPLAMTSHGTDGRNIMRRACVTAWSDVAVRDRAAQSDPIEYDWNRNRPEAVGRPTLAATITAAEKYGYTDTLYGMCGTPEWAGKYGSNRPHYGTRVRESLEDAVAPGLAAAPRPRAYGQFVERLLNRFPRLRDGGSRSGITYLEVWNEADTKQFFRGQPQDLVDLTVTASRVVRRLNRRHPGRVPVKVVAPSFISSITKPSTTSSSWVLANGRKAPRIRFMRTYYRQLRSATIQRGKPWPLDVYNTHGYVEDNYTFLSPGQQSARAQHLTWFVRTMQRLGLPQRPVWDTEFTPLLSTLRHSASLLSTTLIRTYLEGWSAGLSHQFFYSFQDQKIPVGHFGADRLQLTAKTRNLRRVMSNLRAIATGASFQGCRDVEHGRRTRMICDFRKHEATPLLQPGSSSRRIGSGRPHTLELILDTYTLGSVPDAPRVRAIGARHSVDL